MSKHSSKGKTWDATRLRVLDRDGWTCAFCGKPLEGPDATVDHLTSKSEGGTDDLWNLVACCRTDNSRKGARELIRMPYINRKWLTSL